jgi:hypothetical protein
MKEHTCIPIYRHTFSFWNTDPKIQTQEKRIEALANIEEIVCIRFKLYRNKWKSLCFFCPCLMHTIMQVVDAYRMDKIMLIFCSANTAAACATIDLNKCVCVYIVMLKISLILMSAVYFFAFYLFQPLHWYFVNCSTLVSPRGPDRSRRGGGVHGEMQQPTSLYELEERTSSLENHVDPMCHWFCGYYVETNMYICRHLFLNVKIWTQAMFSIFWFCVNPLLVESLFGNLNIRTQVVELLMSLLSNSMLTLNP